MALASVLALYSPLRPVVGDRPVDRPIMGMEHLEALLQGGHHTAEHFRQAPFDRNIPVKRRRSANRGT
jgi:hypothetical protein